MSTAETPNMAAIRRVLSTPRTKIGLNRHDELFLVREESFLLCPTISRDQLAYYLADIAESEWENWVLSIIREGKGKRHLLPGLNPSRVRKQA